MKHFFLPAILLFAILVPSCKKNGSPAATLTANGTIINTGAIAADGCGWLIKLNDNSEYSPVNLSSDFQQDNLKVNVSYIILSTNTACGSVANNGGVRQIKLNTIQKTD
jgi:hypothetical protein